MCMYMLVFLIVFFDLQTAQMTSDHHHLGHTGASPSRHITCPEEEPENEKLWQDFQVRSLRLS